MRSILGNEQQEVLKELQEMLEYYLIYLTRKGYLNSQFNANLLQLNNDGILIIVDFKMQILSKRIRETKQDFYAKCGWALYGTFAIERGETAKKIFF